MKNKVLLVEDVAEVRDGLERSLGARYDVVAVANAEEAVEACRLRGPFGAAVADHGLPGMSGIDLLRKLDHDWPETVGILMTGDRDPAVARNAVTEPAVYRFLEKPCDVETLCRAIDAALERHADLEAAEALSEELRFSKESLQSLTAILEERIDRQTRVSRRLHRFAVDLNAAASLQEIADLCATAACDVLGGRGVHVQLWDDGDGRLGVEAARGPEMSADMHRVSVCASEGTLGEINVDRSGPHDEALGEAEISVLASIASSAAVAAHNEVRRGERDRAQQATILALARLAERRDQETGKHLERVAAYCKLIAEGLREDGKHVETITSAYVEDLVRSSPLHDIGKVGIPDSILLKPGKLTPEEWEIMKSHAEIGALTLDSVIQEFGRHGFLAMGRDIAWCHHEKWDGGGYPRGQRGEDIPLAARILALADVYDALTTVRPYKKAWAHTDAIEWIRGQAGSHFDPDVAAAFIARQDEAEAIRGRLADASQEIGATDADFEIRS